MPIGQREHVLPAGTLIETVRPSVRTRRQPASLKALTTCRVGCSLTMQLSLEN
jgi:hypothetical protein